MISTFRGKQPAGDNSHKASSRLPLVSDRPAVSFSAPERQHPGR